ncbi:IclR family transcriptional regulator [Succinivibrio dextrinosolvens]|jgi:IclR family KDG regulon transcriptional repressor|uniref:Transcriptional regulator, IclR family n=1 Tax=Succinivibrio dextrinosolvens DSM 3072 TaxID=1123324 RepID=A0A1T4VA78_9GAMM|nr:IclR family transcriptional regulator [Succinivibrio dextrinosolvens]MBE6423609.1 IclR family transcriptional regulator [Succinivibrio dextrinosolvens]SKA61864.1 transcriptional regulator, IclR family [Succinivibrio dextrinosolvens DSM 3072]
MASKIRVPALERALNILEVLQKHHRCTISELISITGLPRSSVYVLVDDMVKLRLLRQNSDKTVQLWMKLVSLGNSASDSLDLKEMISPYLDKLISSVDCLAVHFGIMDDDKAYYVLKRTSSKSGMRILSREGAEVSLVHSALGKCLLAYQDSMLRERIVTTLDYTPATANSITSPEALRKELAQIRNRGYAFDNAEVGLELRCIAVPIFDLDNHLIGAISVVGTINNFTTAKLPSIIDLMKRSSISISSGLML